MTTSEFEEHLRLSSELAISFDGDFSHEEYDEADPRDFHEHFELAGDVAFVLKYDGSIVSSYDETALIIRDPKLTRSVLNARILRRSKVADYTRKLIRRMWGEETEEIEEERVVGTVHGSEISRDISVFCPTKKGGKTT